MSNSIEMRSDRESLGIGNNLDGALFIMRQKQKIEADIFEIDCSVVNWEKVAVDKSEANLKSAEISAILTRQQITADRQLSTLNNNDEEEEEAAADNVILRLRSPEVVFTHEQFHELLFKTGYDLVSINKDGDTIRNNHDLYNISQLNKNRLKPSTLREALDLVSLNMFSHQNNSVKKNTLKLSLSRIVTLIDKNIPAVFEKEIKKFEGGDMMWKRIVKAKEDVLAGEHSRMSKKSKELVERILKNGKDEDQNLDQRLLEIVVCEERLKLLKKKADDFRRF
ncbi:hypothetical protein BDC45DRAFT_537420 [Circinella umbellata]|nr:hypothetical protein BDC45DRAFT_537420 [Circinella umbellata]